MLNSNRGFFDNHVFVQLQDSKHICQQVRPLKVSAISQWLIFLMQWNDDHSLTPGTLNPGTIKSQVHKHQEAVNLKCYIRTRIPGWSIKYLRLHFIFNEYVFSWSIAKSQKTEKPTYDHISLSLTYNWCVLRYSQVTGLNKNFCRCCIIQYIYIHIIGELIREENYKGNAKTFISRLWDRWFIQFADFIVKVWLNRADPLVRPNLAAAVEVKDVLNGRSSRSSRSSSSGS